MAAHLRKCVVARMPAKANPPSQVLLLRVQASGASMFWLDAAAADKAKLNDMDGLLRDVWLECCGHLSEFYTGRYDTVRMSVKISDAFGSIGARLGYVYDWGSSTELVVSLSGIVQGHCGDTVRVVARNEPPVWPCDECGKPATAVCTECSWEGAGFCCAEHAGHHECGEDMLLPVVNSPRMGVCGYTG